MARKSDVPICKIESLHFPAEKLNVLKDISPKLFENIPSVLYLAKGVNVMLLRNINPSLGLFNGAIFPVVGPLYLDDVRKSQIGTDQLRQHTISSFLLQKQVGHIPSQSVIFTIEGKKALPNWYSVDFGENVTIEYQPLRILPVFLTTW